MSVTPPPFSNFQFGIFMLGLAQNKPSPAPNSHWTEIDFLVYFLRIIEFGSVCYPRYKYGQLRLIR